MTATPSSQTPKTNPDPIEAAYAKVAPKIDGVLDDAVWAIAPRYALTYDQSRLDKGMQVVEGGYGQFAWDDSALYVATAFVDSDVYTRVTGDNQKTWDLGDVAEWFLGACDGSYYWEMHVCPPGYRTGFLLTAPRVGKPLEPLTYTAAAKVGSVPVGSVPLSGSAEKGTDPLSPGKTGTDPLSSTGGKAPGWSAEFRMTWEALRQVNPKFGPQTPWRCLVARYNYNRSGPKPELSMYPAQPRLDYHAIDHHAPLRLMPRG
jgi:hypothetical protein